MTSGVSRAVYRRQRTRNFITPPGSQNDLDAHENAQSIQENRVRFHRSRPHAQSENSMVATNATVQPERMGRGGILAILASQTNTAIALMMITASHQRRAGCSR